jgi:uncharacterized protein (TIGR00369 family)
MSFVMPEERSDDPLKAEYLPHSGGCFVCGDENPCGIRARFFVQGDSVRTRVVLPGSHNGYQGAAHGGVLAGLLDEAMGWAATVFSLDHRFFVTGELKLKYLFPVEVGVELEVEARMVKDGRRIVYCQGALLQKGKVCLRGQGKFLPMSEEETRAVVSYLKRDGCRRYRTLFGRAE